MRYLTTQQVATRLGVSPATVKRWSEKGVLRPTVTLPSGYRRFDPAQVEDFVLKLEGVRLGVDPRLVDAVREAECAN